jgi:RNA 3'-terminal phosphate cyclase (ATP)
MIEIDGSHGEGGGQVLRTCLSLAALTGRPFCLHHIRANREQPGLRPQHLTAVRAVAAICQADLQGDHLNADRLEFYPQSRPQGGSYSFDVAEATSGGSAGAATLIFQALLWPLLLAGAPSQLTLHGGTHVPFSPPYHYLSEVAGPAFKRLGAEFDLGLTAWGWYPAGGGTIKAEIRPIPHLQAVPFTRQPSSATGQQPSVAGLAAVSNLPAHIPHRMARRADNLLRQAGWRSQITAVRESGRGPGAGIMLWLPQAGFSSLGRPGLPADKVAETAVSELFAFVKTEADVDKRLADQLLLPLALARGKSEFTTDRLTQHTLTNADLLQRWLDISLVVTGEVNQPGQITVEGRGFAGMV